MSHIFYHGKIPHFDFIKKNGAFLSKVKLGSFCEQNCWLLCIALLTRIDTSLYLWLISLYLIVSSIEIRGCLFISTSYTDSIKINRPGYNMYWVNFWQPSIHVQQKAFEKTLIEVYIPYLYASIGTFCAKIDEVFEAEWVFEVCLEIDKSLLSK